MPIDHRLGKIPAKRHTVFRQKNGSLYLEHLMGNTGFGGISSLLYHIRPPVTIGKVRCLHEVKWVPDVDKTLRLRHFFAGRMEPATSISMDRTPILFNEDVTISIVCPTQTDDFFYRNSQGDELIFVSDGHGVLESIFGTLAYRPGDTIVIPRRSFTVLCCVMVPTAFWWWRAADISAHLPIIATSTAS